MKTILVATDFSTLRIAQLPPGPIQVLVATRTVDFRKGMSGLAAVVQEQLGADPF